MPPDQKTIDAMRDAVVQGLRASEILQLPNLDELRSGQLFAVWCFRLAFDLTLGEAMAVGAWRGFPGGSWSDAEIDAALQPLIDRFRKV